MTDQQKMQYIQYMAMKEELDNVAFGGIGLQLDGQRASSRAIAAACVFQEEIDYMRDYRRDDTGYVAELSFNKVRQSFAGPPEPVWEDMAASVPQD